MSVVDGLLTAVGATAPNDPSTWLTSVRGDDGGCLRKLVDGERIQVDDVRVMVSKAGLTLTFELEPDLLAAVGGKTYKVVSVQPLAGAYVLQLRGNPS